MENVLEPLQPSISLRNFLEQYKKKLDCGDNVPFYFDTTSPVSEDVESSCSLQLLSSPEDNPINIFEPGAEVQRAIVKTPIMNQHVPETYKAMTEEKARSRRNPFMKTQYSHRLMAEPMVNGELGILGEYELQISVRFYRPPRAAHRNYKLERPVLSEEFICLGSNYLTELHLQRLDMRMHQFN